jgi:hypothetical protein
VVLGAHFNDEVAVLPHNSDRVVRGRVKCQHLIAEESTAAKAFITQPHSRALAMIVHVWLWVSTRVRDTNRCGSGMRHELKRHPNMVMHSGALPCMSGGSVPLHQRHTSYQEARYQGCTAHTCSIATATTTQQQRQQHQQQQQHEQQQRPQQRR